MKHLIATFLCLICGGQSFAQNYIEYHKIFNRLDEDILSGDYSKSLFRLDTVDAQFDFVYAKHCVKALQICVQSQDSVKANLWLGRCLKAGLPLWVIKANDLTNKSLKYYTTQNTLKKLDSFVSIRTKSIDTSLRRIIDSLLVLDQKYTRPMNDGFLLFKPFYWLRWGMNNQRQFKILKRIILEKGYPEERLIGLSFLKDSQAFLKHFTFWGPSELRDSKVQIMLQHCFSTWHKMDIEFQKQLLKNLETGYIPAFQYALLIDFMSPNTINNIEYKFWPNSKFRDNNSINKIDSNRYSVGLNSISQENNNTLLERERRKNKKANSAIMLE